MKKLLMLGLAVALTACGGEPVEEVTEETQAEVEQVAEQIAETAETEQVEEASANEPVSKQDAENYMMTVQSAVDEVQKFNPDTDMSSYASIQDRMNAIRDEGDKFKGSEFDNCRLLAIYPLDVFYLVHGKNSIDAKMELYNQVTEACQRQIDDAK